jgi:hypothetical protein
VPALPWTTVGTPASPVRACTIFATQLPLRSYRHLPRLLWLTLRIRRHITHSPGLLGYALDLEVRHKTLWTTSAWANRSGLAAFDRSAPHRTAKQALRSAILAPRFAVWTCPIDQLPVRRHETRARLKAVNNPS